MSCKSRAIICINFAALLWLKIFSHWALATGVKDSFSVRVIGTLTQNKIFNIYAMHTFSGEQENQNIKQIYDCGQNCLLVNTLAYSTLSSQTCFINQLFVYLYRTWMLFAPLLLISYCQTV
jgi:hypothetical protein